MLCNTAMVLQQQLQLGHVPNFFLIALVHVHRRRPGPKRPVLLALASDKLPCISISTLTVLLLLLHFSW
jgi:hypothetical protein